MNSLKILLLILCSLSSLIATIFCISIALSDYKSLIVDRCFNETTDRKPLTLGQHNPVVGMSIENLISLIDKLEIKRPELSAQQIVVMILKRFHIDGLFYDRSSGLIEPSVTEMLHRRVTDQIMHSTSLPSVPDFPEEAFTEHEKCALFYTISHTVNDTAAHHEPKSNTWQRSPHTSSPNASIQILTKHPREQGVASFRNNIDEAIAVNRVLLGTAVGLLNPQNRTLKDIIKSIVPDFSGDSVYDEQLCSLLAVTLSDLPAFGLNVEVLEYGVTGKWNSSACQTSYRLDYNDTLLTLAEIRGGIDGYNIGRKVFDIVSRNINLSLSQILRMYYSNRGLTPDSGYCKRNPDVNLALLRKFMNEALNYMRVWNWVKHGGLFADSELNDYIDKNKEDYLPHLELAVTKADDNTEFCEPSKSVGESACESLADVIFMIDNMSGAHPDSNLEQIEVITQVVRALDLRRIGGGSVTVLTNSEAQSLGNNNSISTALYALAYNTTCSQCASCRSAWFNYGLWPISDGKRLLELINQTLIGYAAKRESLSGVPSKNFVWFEFGNLKLPSTDQTAKNRYNQIKRRLLHEHRDVTFFFASDNNESIVDLLPTRDKQLISLGKGVANAIEEGKALAKKVCKTPAIFQYMERSQRKSDSDVYDGYITPGYKQYWAMYPKYFIGSSGSIEFTFRAENVRLKVCFDRYPEPELQQSNCKQPHDRSNGEVKFLVNNPCEQKTLENCEPFYFTVSLGRQSRVASHQCVDRRCKSLDQMKWTVKWNFRHTCIACSSSTYLNAYAVLVLTMVLVILYFF